MEFTARRGIFTQSILKITHPDHPGSIPKKSCDFVSSQGGQVSWVTLIADDPVGFEIQAVEPLGKSPNPQLLIVVQDEPGHRVFT